MRTIWDTVFSRCEVASSINSLSLRINKVTPIHACKRSSIFRSQASRRLLKVIQFSAFWSGIIIWSFLWRFFFCTRSIALSGLWIALAFAIAAAKKPVYFHFSSPSPPFFTFEKLTIIFLLSHPWRYDTREWARELVDDASHWRCQIKDLTQKYIN